MTYYHYYYEVSSKITDKMNLVLGETYVLFSSIAICLLAMAIFSLILFTAIAVKKGRIYGIISTVFPPLGLVFGWISVIFWTKVDFGCFDERVTASSSDAAIERYMEKVVENLMESFSPVAALICGLLWLVSIGCLIFGIVYMGLLFGSKGKVASIFAFVVAILNVFLLPPVPAILWIFQWFGQESWKIYCVWEVWYCLAYTFPFLLISLQGLINIILNIKKAVEKKREKRYAELSRGPVFD